jgi:hypothetical protein
MFGSQLIVRRSAVNSGRLQRRIWPFKFASGRGRRAAGFEAKALLAEVKACWPQIALWEIRSGDRGRIVLTGSYCPRLNAIGRVGSRHAWQSPLVIATQC